MLISERLEQGLRLGGSVWTTDHDRGIEVARRVQSGTIGVDHYSHEPSAPFGGIKSSGPGRELGPEAMTGYQVLKSIYLDPKVVGQSAQG